MRIGGGESSLLGGGGENSLLGEESSFLGIGAVTGTGATETGTGAKGRLELD